MKKEVVGSAVKLARLGLEGLDGLGLGPKGPAGD